jgi:hypothetical protein
MLPKKGGVSMKRYLGALVLVNLVMSWTGLAEAASLSILPDPLVGAPGNTLLTSVVYSAQGAQVAGLQFDILYDQIALSLSTAQAGSAATLATKDLSFNTLSPGDTRSLIFGLNQNVIGDGSVADLTFQVALNAPTGPYNLHLSGIVGTDPNGNNVTITNLNPASIPEPSTLLLLGSGVIGLWFLRALIPQ